MKVVYLISWAIVTSLIFFFVGLAFLPHTAASLLAPSQKLLTKKYRGR